MALSSTTINNIDDEWSSFITQTHNESSSDEENNQTQDEFNGDDELNSPDTNIFSGVAPTPTNIYISTKSKIAYLEQPIDLKIFWDIPVIPYATPSNGVIKKQIKLNSKTAEDLLMIQDRLKKELYFDEHIMSHIDNPNGRIKFKDIRKITVGISKKDIMSYRLKKKQAFYNCFVMILRIKIDECFREFHIKVFNTGKLEIPGVQSEAMFEIVLQHIIQVLQPHHDYPLSYKQSSDTVLINSNFNCGFYINRETLYDILRNKYTIQAIYDPCSYPGIQCKFMYNHDIVEQNGKQISAENKGKYTKITEVSFMIFRTGSVLIVGMCDENVLEVIYDFIKKIFRDEFKYICQRLISQEDINQKNKKKKIRRKVVKIMTSNQITSNDETETETETNDNSYVTPISDDIVIGGIVSDTDNIDSETGSKPNINTSTDTDTNIKTNIKTNTNIQIDIYESDKYEEFIPIVKTNVRSKTKPKTKSKTKQLSAFEI